MPRGLRLDRPDSWHHVTNRAIARRTLFEDARDVRLFLARLAHVVRAGLIEVHSYCVLTTHFHLLVRSPTGELSAAMQSVENEYSRWFNRSRKRDGPLYRGRFLSKPVETLTYRRHLVGYIDANPVQAGLATAPALYPHCSARHYARGKGPPWLSRGWVENHVKERMNLTEYDPLTYASAFGGPLSPRIQRLVERRIVLSRTGHDPLDELLHATNQNVLDWMRRKSLLADGTEIGIPLCVEEDVDEVLALARTEFGVWRIRGKAKWLDAWPHVHVALLRELTGATLDRVGHRLGVSPNGVWILYSRHKSLVQEDSLYADRVATLTLRSLDSCHR